MEHRGSRIEREHPNNLKARVQLSSNLFNTTFRQYHSAVLNEILENICLLHGHWIRHDSSNCTNLAVYSVTSSEVFRTRYSISRQFLGSGDGAVVRALASQQFDPGMSLWLVLALLREFSSGFSGFSPPPPPPPQKNSISITNSTRLEGLNENPLFLSKYFNSNFYFSLCNKDRRASRGQKKGGH